MNDEIFAPKPITKTPDNQVIFYVTERTRDIKHPKTDQWVKDGLKLKFKVPEKCSVLSETILLAVLQIASKEREILPEDHESKLKPKRGAIGKQSAIGRVSAYELMKRAGMRDGGSYYERFRKECEHLNDIRVTYRNKATREWGQSGLVNINLNDKDKTMGIEVNWLLTDAIMLGNSYANICLEERNALKQNRAKMLHRWLSGYVRQGQTKRLLIETLIQHVWPIGNPTPKTLLNHHSKLKNHLLPKIGKLPNWTVLIDNKVATITRKKDFIDQGQNLELFS